MPKTPVNYSDTIFYRLVYRDLTITDVYVGCTTNFRQRKLAHKNNCSNEKSIKYDLRVYTFIRNNGGWENWTMIMIHRQSCVDALEAHTVERGYVELLGATLNSCVPGRTLQESQTAYCEAHPDRIRESRAAFKEAHRDQIAAYRESRRDINKLYAKQYYAKKRLLKQQQQSLAEII